MTKPAEIILSTAETIFGTLTYVTLDGDKAGRACYAAQRHNGAPAFSVEWEASGRQIGFAASEEAAVAMATDALVAKAALRAR